MNEIELSENQKAEVEQLIRKFSIEHFNKDLLNYEGDMRTDAYTADILDNIENFLNFLKNMNEI